MPRKPAHPNGATVFLNWLLSREGQTIYSRTLKQPGVRADIPAPEGLRAEALPPTGEKPFQNDTEENILIRPKLMSDADAIIKGISK